MNFTFPGGEQGWLALRRGEIAGLRKWSETRISSSGGGGTLYQGSGHIAAPQISSTSIEKCEFWIKAPDGEIRMTANVAVRDGHEVTVACGNKVGQDRGNYFFFLNHSTGQYWFLENGGRFETFYNQSALAPLRKKIFAVGAVFAVIVAGTRANSDLCWIAGIAAAVYVFVQVHAMNAIKHRNRVALAETINGMCS